MTEYYPVNLNITGRHCLVVGGGGVGTRKVKGLLACGAQVTLVSPEATAAAVTMAEKGEIRWEKRHYRASDLADVFLVIGATDNETLNHQIYTDASQRQLLCNIADRPSVCNFILPAVVRQGDLLLTASTSGKSPAFAKRLKRELEAQFDVAYAQLLTLMGRLRARLLAAAHAPEEHKPLFEALLENGLLEKVRAKDVPAIDRLLADVLGPGFVYAQLMETEKENH